MDSSSDNTEKHYGPNFEVKEVDVAAQLTAGADNGPLEPEVATRIRYCCHVRLSE